MTEVTPDDVVKNPNFKLSIQASQHVLQIRTPINRLVLVACLNNETVGAMELTRENVGKLTEQTKINALLQVMSTLQIPFAHLEKYGNIKRKDIGYDMNEANRRAKE